MKSTQKQAIDKLNDLISHLRDYSGQEIKNNVQILVKGINELDQEVRQKTFEVQNREQLLVQRDNLLVQKESVINQKTAEVQNTKQVLAQKEQKVGELQKTVFADSLHKLYPDSYSAKVEEWPDTLPMKKHVVNNDVQVMERNTAIYKPLIEEKEKETIKKEFVKSLNELDPYNYTTDPTTWFYKDGRGPLPMKVHYDNNNYEVMVKNTKTYKKEIEEIKAKKLEEAKKLKEETIQKEQLLAQKDQLLSNKDNILNEKDQAIEALKLLIAQKELEKQELLSQTENISTVKDKLLADKDREMQSLREELVQKDREREELRVEKDLELANKSLVKNQVIDELQEDIGLKEKEALNLKIELLTKQLEFKSKESELKEKALADAHIINELQGKLLAFKDLSKHDETLKLELSVIHFKVEESILNGNVDEMKELSKYLSQLMKNPLEKDESLEISELLNLSPIGYVEANIVQNPVAVINNGNFDIDNQHITHSVLLSGGESFSIIQEESFN